MSHTLAKKFDKIVSKLSHKHKDTKLHASDPTDAHFYREDASADGNDDTQHESILQRMKGHLGHMTKHEHHQQPDGIPPSHVIADDLKDSPFKSKKILSYFFICA
jgi:hypothetical protein